MTSDVYGRFDIAASTMFLVSRQAGPSQPQDLFRAFDELCRKSVGHRLLTLLVWSPERNDVQRVYSSRPAEYPPGNRKPMGPTAWGKIVLHGSQTWIGRTAEDMRWAFPDHELIASLGCESCLNAPVRWNGRVLGAVSFLDVRDAYTDADLAGLDVVAQLLAPAFLALAE